MKLYNTLTRSIEDLKPLNPPVVTLYTCGPTVYDYTHVGHWFTYVRWDTLVRALRANGLEPKWVMNITDVGHLVSDADDGEDKLEKGAKREGKTAWEVAGFYLTDFMDGMKELGNCIPEHMPKATQHIPEQIDLIKKLEEKGYTYLIDDGVYYDTSKFPRYADFARLDTEEQQAGARVEYNQQKHNASDFALWKFSPEEGKRDMEWDSPWGKGFPGWHIECSAMSMKYLGDTLDIHTGGIDHIPVHHTNEIAQSEAVTGKPFANLWLHSNHVTISGEKISKSLGNGIRLEDITAKGYSAMALRLHILESHYRSQSKFSWESLEAAHNRLQKLQAFADLRFQAIDPGDYEIPELDYTEYADSIKSAMLDDLMTPKALAVLSRIADERHEAIPASEKATFESFLTFIDQLFGLRLLESHDITAGQKQLIAERQQARETKDWAKSDELRDTLHRQGITTRDTAYGTIWSRI